MLIERKEMTFILVAHLEILSDLAAQLFGARLFCIEMVETRLARDQFAVLSDLQALSI